MTITNAHLFVAAGQTLFGERWQQPLATLLGWPIDERGQNRTVQRIKAAAEKGEEYRINPAVMEELAKVLDERGELCREAADAIRTSQK